MWCQPQMSYCNVTPIWAKNRNIDSRIPRSNQILRLSATLANQGASFIRGSLRQQKIKWTTKCRLISPASACTVCHSGRGWIQKNLDRKRCKNTRWATNGAVKIFQTYLKAKNMSETFENFTNLQMRNMMTLLANFTLRSDKRMVINIRDLACFLYGMDSIYTFRSLEMLTSWRIQLFKYLINYSQQSPNCPKTWNVREQWHIIRPLKKLVPDPFALISVRSITRSP